MAEQQRLSEVFVELADTLVDDFDVVEFLTTLAHRSAELLHAAEAGVVLADERDVLRSVASSTETARLLDLFELQNQEGPCLDCFRLGEQVLNQSLGDPNPWPAFAPEARRLGYAMVHALPMQLRGRVIGAVNVFATDDRPLSAAEVAVGQALADIATIGLLQERGMREARQLSERLQSALHSRVVIEQAKGVLAERGGLDLDDAFEVIRQHARSTNQKLSDVAAGVVEDRITVADLGL
jgi:GAF domain-containing protein